MGWYIYMYHNKAAYIKLTLNDTEILTTQLIEKLHINIKNRMHTLCTYPILTPQSFPTECA